jgi:hypothetical protein
LKLPLVSAIGEKPARATETIPNAEKRTTKVLKENRRGHFAGINISIVQLDTIPHPGAEVIFADSKHLGRICFATRGVANNTEEFTNWLHLQ